MKCIDIEKILSDYVEGNLPQDLIKTVEDHLKSCSTCWQLAEEISWVIEKCGDFPVIDPPARLKNRILEKTSPAQKPRNILDIIFHPQSYKKLSPAYTLSTVIMILLIIGALINFSGIVKNLNRYTHQAYSIGLKYYYNTEKIKEEISTMREDLPSTLDKRIAKSIGWIKSKIKKEEKKDGGKKEKVELLGNEYFLNT